MPQQTVKNIYLKKNDTYIRKVYLFPSLTMLFFISFKNCASAKQFLTLLSSQNTHKSKPSLLSHVLEIIFINEMSASVGEWKITLTAHLKTLI